MPVRVVRDLRQDRLGGAAVAAAAVAQAVLRRRTAAPFDDADDFAIDDEAPDVSAHRLAAAEFDAFGKACGGGVESCRVCCTDGVKDHALSARQHRGSVRVLVVGRFAR